MKNKLILSLLCATAIGGTNTWASTIEERVAALESQVTEINSLDGIKAMKTEARQRAAETAAAALLSPTVSVHTSPASSKNTSGTVTPDLTAEETQRLKKGAAAINAQKITRGFLARKKFKTAKEQAAAAAAATRISSKFRAFIAEKKFKSMKEAAAAESKKLELQQAQLTAQMEALLTQQSELSRDLLALNTKSASYLKAKQRLEELSTRYETERTQLQDAQSRLDAEKDAIDALATEYDEKAAEAEEIFAKKSGSIYKKAVKTKGDSDGEALKAEILKILIDDETNLLKVPEYRAAVADIKSGKQGLAKLESSRDTAQADLIKDFDGFEAGAATQRQGLEDSLTSVTGEISKIKAKLAKAPDGLPNLGLNGLGGNSAATSASGNGNVSSGLTASGLSDSGLGETNTSISAALSLDEARAIIKAAGRSHVNATARMRTADELNAYIQTNGLK